MTKKSNQSSMALILGRRDAVRDEATKWIKCFNWKGAILLSN